MLTNIKVLIDKLKPDVTGYIRIFISRMKELRKEYYCFTISDKSIIILIREDKIKELGLNKVKEITKKFIEVLTVSS